MDGRYIIKTMDVQHYTVADLSFLCIQRDAFLVLSVSHCRMIMVWRLHAFIALHLVFISYWAFSFEWVLLSEGSNPLVYFLCSARKKWESTVWEVVFPKLFLLDWHTERVCKVGCLYGLHAGLRTWQDGKERQEAWIFCKVRNSALGASAFTFSWITFNIFLSSAYCMTKEKLTSWPNE